MYRINSASAVFRRFCKYFDAMSQTLLFRLFYNHFAGRGSRGHAQLCVKQNEIGTFGFATKEMLLKLHFVRRWHV